jgi:hypothetical protein
MHRLSEAFEDSVIDLSKKKRESARVSASLSGFATFSKEIHEGWENLTPNLFGYLNTPLDPQTETGKQIAKELGGVEEVKKHYDNILRVAKDDTKMNATRNKEVKQVYGIDVPNPSTAKVPGPTQVYAVGNSYIYTKEQASQICAKYGGHVATSKQLEEAQQMGANWCYSGWVREGTGKWPITTQPIGGCGGRQGIIEWTPYAPQYGWHGKTAGINCYGPKPRPDEKTGEYIWPFNDTLWDQPAEKTYITVPSGYLESSGPSPGCFNNISPQQAQKTCDRLGAQCVGFNYSKDGTGSGCYKGNHAGGMNDNPNYTGYVKIPASTNEPVYGRYIRLDYDRIECLNLAQILVYSSQGGPNVITPQTKVTKSSGYNGDAYPSPNFVNQRGMAQYNFVHTSCYDVPWIEVDLGSVIQIHKVVVWNRVDCCQSRIIGTRLSVLDQEREKVYISNPIRTTNQSYTWLLPNGDVYPDKDPIPFPTKQRVYGNNGTTSCEQYCRGVSGGPWNNELPAHWNGARCSGHAPSIANCSSGFTYSSSTYCECEKTGTGWDTRGWRGPP